MRSAHGIHMPRALYCVLVVDVKRVADNVACEQRLVKVLRLVAYEKPPRQKSPLTLPVSVSTSILR
jgi:hypothetical protein